MDPQPWEHDACSRTARSRCARPAAHNSTHYASTADQIAFGTRLVAELAGRGAPGKHFVINTSSNGRPFDFGRARGSHPDNAKV